MRRLPWALLLLVANALATSSHAAIIDSSRSKASFSIHPRLPLPSEGRFELVKGALIALPGQQMKVEVLVDARKLSFKGPQWLSRMARSEAFLNAEQHPDIQFVSVPFSKTLLEKGGLLKGQLFLRGQQRSVSFQIEHAA